MLFTVTPYFYNQMLRGFSSPNEFVQAQSLPNGYSMLCSLQTEEQSQLRHETVVFTMRIVVSFSLLAVGIFKLVQGRTYAPYLWLELKLINNLLLTAVASSMIMFQYPIAILACLILIVMRFARCLVPMPETHYDFTWRSFGISAVLSVLWLTLSLGVILTGLLGTVVEQVDYDFGRLQERMLELTQTAILDYECVGSRFWLAVLTLVVPNILVLFKIISN